MKKIYLDYAAATPLLPAVAKAMAPFGVMQFANPSAIYLAARDVRLAIDRARADVAAVLGAKPGEVIFCSGTTEANNLAIGGLARAHPRARMAIGATNHQASLRAAEGYAGGRVDRINVTSSGEITPTALRPAIKPTTILVSIDYANSETGAIQPLPRLAGVIADVRAERRARGSNLPIYLHTDASAAANYLSLKVSRLGVDLLSLGGSKIYGPKTSGVLFIKGGVKLEPLMFGGGQERGLRAGSEDAASIVGLAKALVTVQASAVGETDRLQILGNELIEKLTIAVPTLVLHGAGQRRLPNILSLGLPVSDGERLVMELDQIGVLAATGAACSANLDQPSHVLLAMGLTPRQASGNLRLSLGRGTARSDVLTAARRIATVVSRQT